MPVLQDTFRAPLISTAAARLRGRAPGLLLLVAAAAVAACGTPRGPAFEPSPETRAAPRPALVETERLRVRLAGADAEAARLADATAALEARAAGLRARAAALGGPVVEPERRARLMPQPQDGAEP